MKVQKVHIPPPPDEELVPVLSRAFASNYESSSVSIEPCPDLRQAPFHLASQGLSNGTTGASSKTADIGGQPNLFPEPRLDRKFSLLSIASAMEMNPDQGSLLGAGAGPFDAIGVNTELSANLSWGGSFANVTNHSYFTKVNDAESKQATTCEESPTTDCALMMNLYGSEGRPGPVLKITARGRRGDQKSFTECIRQALRDHYGDGRPISLGGVFVLKRGTARVHVMPDFPPKDQLPWTSGEQVQDWLTFHDFEAPMVCLSVMHTSDALNKNLELRVEHTHCFSVDGSGRGGHYHHDLPANEAIEQAEYEGYFHTAEWVYRIDRPEVTLERD